MRPTVVHLLGGLGFGGNEALCLQIVRHAPPDVASVVIHQDPARTELLALLREVPGLQVRCVPTRGRARLVGAWMLAKEIRTLRPVAVLIYAFGMHHVLAALSAFVAGVSSVHAAAGNPASDDRGRRKWRAVLWLSAALGVPVHSCSAAVEHSLRELGGASHAVPERSSTAATSPASQIGRAGPAGCAGATAALSSA
jgi:hypothetical protein